jgi:methylmalonyl-CoA mutase cobalamin-binding domain/chain
MTKDSMEQHPLRIVLAKVGLDGHDRGIKVVARALRDAGMHVIYAGLWQTPEAVARTVAEEDADWLGLSLLSGAHLTLVPRVMEALRENKLAQVNVMVGGIIPETDVPRLQAMGVAQVFGPGTSLDDIVTYLKKRSEADHA